MNNLSAQLLEAASLMGLGMAFVFAFLSLAIVAVNLLARLAGETAPEPAAPATQATADPGLGPRKLAAISAAIAQYKNNHKH
ncbi:OadG family transporter subunit [Oceanimonas pelagia]|uniref:Probable oxaloacetate decarboxylase gamma chain n=1 Tax=Oceanimonas pelagia TaxID=3028314 RepID=A0AA50KNL0_9GAMM|nr:OadG family transporter subunit [Oceanimonas pelagia]WMC11145.1 OadG family transporter subunit [Oceanimonas pelagia]